MLAPLPSPPPQGRGSAELLRAPSRCCVEKLVKEYPRKGTIRRASASCSSAGPRPSPRSSALSTASASGRSRRERRTGRRIRLRQIHDLHHGDAPHRQDRRRHHVRRRGYRRDPGQAVRQAADAQTHPDGVPGPDRQPQSALHRGARDRRSDPAAGRHEGTRRRARALRRARPPGRPAGRAARPLSRISSRAARRRASASRARSRSTPISSSSTSRPRRSTCRCRRWCSISCRTSRIRWG